MIRTLRPALSALLLLALVAAPGCKKKETTTAPAANAAADALGNVDIPKDATSKTFAGKILTHDVTNFAPTDSYAAKLVYKTLHFKNNNSWGADAVLGVGEDSVGCHESGTWTMEPASDDHTADVNVKITDTTCPGRQQQNMMRLHVHIEKGEYTISVR